MAKPPEIIVIGSHAPGLLIQVKRIPLAGETVMGWGFEEPMDGGKGSNQAIAAARLGASVSFVGCIGKDKYGDDGRQWLLDAGVDIRYLIQSKTQATGVGFIILDSNGIPAMVTSIGANAEINTRDIEAAVEQNKGSRVLLTQFEIPVDTAIYAARLARRHQMISIINPAPAIGASIAGLKEADILIPNDLEAKLLLGMDPTEDVDLRELADTLRIKSGANCVIVTAGASGAVLADSTEVWHVESPEVNVVDTSGAGDEFCAALAVSLVHGRSMRSAVEWSCMVASLSVTKPGTIAAFPNLAEVNEYLNTLVKSS